MSKKNCHSKLSSESFKHKQYLDSESSSGYHYDLNFLVHPHQKNIRLGIM